jgi:hypothetical protein
MILGIYRPRDITLLTLGLGKIQDQAPRTATTSSELAGRNQHGHSHHPPPRHTSHHHSGPDRIDRLDDFTTTAPSIYTHHSSFLSPTTAVHGKKPRGTASVASGVALQRRSRTGVSHLEGGNRRLVFYTRHFCEGVSGGTPCFFSFLFRIIPLHDIPLFSRSFWLLALGFGSDRTGSVPGYRLGLSRSDRDTGTHKPPE